MGMRRDWKRRSIYQELDGFEVIKQFSFDVETEICSEEREQRAPSILATICATTEAAKKTRRCSRSLARSI